jgi:hypothetical protein
MSAILIEAGSVPVVVFRNRSSSRNVSRQLAIVCGLARF